MKLIYNIASVSNSGGMERILSYKANYLAERMGYEVVVITTEGKGVIPYFSFSPKIRFVELEINYGGLRNCSLLAKSLAFLRKLSLHRRRLDEVLRREQADIVISMFGNEKSFLYKLRDGSKKIVEIHFSKYFRMQQERKELWKYVDKIRSWRDAAHIRKYDRFVVLTREDRSYWGASYGNIVVIPNFVPHFPEELASLTDKRVIAVGRVQQQKGYDRLLDAWEIVSREALDWKLDIFGGTSPAESGLLDTLREEVSRKGMTGSVEFHPPTQEIEEEYRKSSLLVMSSRYEGLPMVLIEAMSCGLPPVAFACKCGPRDVIVDGDSGLLVEEGNVPGLAKALLRVMKDEDLRRRLGHGARERSLRYTADEVMEQWVRLFRLVLDGKE